MKKVHGGNVWDASSRLGLPVGEIIDFSASINPCGPSRHVKEAIRRSLPLLPSYPDPDNNSLRESLASFHGLSPNEILPANGSTELIYLIPQVLKPRSALIIEPAFSEYRASLLLSGSSVDSFMLKERDGFSLSPERLVEALRGRRYSLVYLGNPANPTGSLIKRDEVIRVASICKKAGAYLVVDEAFIDFKEEESLKRCVRRFGNLLVLRSMTKFFSLTGLRLGYMVADERIIKRFKDRIPPWSVNTLASASAVAALKDRGYMERTKGWLEKERPFLLKGLGSIEGLKAYPSNANFVMARIDKNGLDAPRLKRLLLREGILIRELSDFRGLGKRYFRVAVKRRGENRMLLDALGRIF